MCLVSVAAQFIVLRLFIPSFIFWFELNHFPKENVNKPITKNIILCVCVCRSQWRKPAGRCVCEWETFTWHYQAEDSGVGSQWSSTLWHIQNTTGKLITSRAEPVSTLVPHNGPPEVAEPHWCGSEVTQQKHIVEMLEFILTIALIIYEIICVCNVCCVLCLGAGV